MKKKNFNTICYRGGYGGHFLSTIISLDLSTYPLFPTYYTSDEDSLEIRKNLYSFKNLKKYKNNWYEFHNDYKDFNIEKFVKSKYSTVNYIFHLFEEDFSSAKFKLFNFKHILIQLDKKFHFIVEDFWREHSVNFINKPSTLKYRKIENEKFSNENLRYEDYYLEYKNKLQPYIVNFENFFISIDTFVCEYEKICDFIELPTHVDYAIELYNDWYDARGLIKYKEIIKCI